jgi:hypothetical protein
VFLVFGKHFADARQMALMAPSLRSSLGLHELTAQAHFLKDFPPQKCPIFGVTLRGKYQTSRGEIFLTAPAHILKSTLSHVFANEIY